MLKKIKRLLLMAFLIITVWSVQYSVAAYQYLKVEYWDVATGTWKNSPTDPPAAHFTKSVSFSVRITARHEDDSIVAAGQGSNTTVIVECSDSAGSPSFPKEEALINGIKIMNVTLNTVDVAQSATTHDFDIRDKNIVGIGHGRLYIKLHRFVDHFEISVPPSTQSAGTAFPITITAKDSKNAIATTFANNVNLSAQIGEISPISISSAAFVNGSATFNVTLYGSDHITYYNVIYATNTVTYPGQPQAPNGHSDDIAVDPGVFNKILMLFPGETIKPGTTAGIGKQGTPASKTAGQPFLNVKVIAVDQYWNPVKTGPYPNISFTSNDPQAVLPPLTPMTDSTEVFNSIALKTAGSRWVEVEELTGNTKSRSTININVAGIDHFVFANIASPQVTTAPFNIIIRAYDAYDNLLTSYNRNGVSLTAITGPGTVTPNTVNFASGVANLNAQVTKAGVDIQLIVNDGAGHFSSSDAFIVNSGVFTKLLILLPDQYHTPGIGTGKSGNLWDEFIAGDIVIARVIVTDDYWNSITDGSALGTNISITSNTGYIESLDEGLPLLASEQDYRVRFFTTCEDTYPYDHEPQRILAAGGARNGTSSDISIHAGGYQKLVLAAPGENLDPGSDPAADGKQGAPSSQESNLAFPLTVAAVDNWWNPIETMPFPTVLFTSGDALATLPFGNQMLGRSVQNFSVKLGALTNQWIKATDVNNVAKNDTVTIAVNHGALHRFSFSNIAPPQSAGVGFAVTVTAQDFNGWTVTNYNNTIALFSYTGNGTFAPNTITFTNGVANPTVTIYRAMEDVKIFCDNGLGSVGYSNLFDVDFQAYTKLLVLLEGEVHTPGIGPGKKNSATPHQAGESVNAIVKAVDDYWNLVDTVTPDVEIFTDKYSVIPSSFQTLVNGQGVFQIAYRTAGIQITTAQHKNTPLINNTSSIFINPAAYVGLQVVAPGEIADPGSATGKTAAPPDDQRANESFTVKVRGVDQFWNKVTSLNAKQIRLTSSDSALDTIAPYTNPVNQNSPFVNGEMDFEIYLSSVSIVTVNASDFTDMTKTAGNVGINVLAGYDYEVTVTSPPPINAGPPATFAITVRLLDGGVPVVGANNGISLTPCLADYSPAGGTLGVTSATLSNGVVSISDQSYNLAKTIRIKITDDSGRGQFSNPIEVKASALYFDITVPVEALVGPPEQFSMVVELRDSSTKQIVTTSDRQLDIEIRSADTGLIGTGTLGAITNMLNNGVVNITQSYTKAENVYFVVKDTYAVTLSGTSKIFRMKADGFKKLQIVAPGETTNPGNSSATGKLGAASTQQAGLSFNLTVRAVDQYWNLAESFNGEHIILASSDGSLNETNPANQGASFVNGLVYFVVKLNNFGNIGITCSDEDNPLKPIQTVTIPVSYATYQFVTPINAPSGPPDIFTVMVTLIDGITMAPLIANHTFTMAPVFADYSPTSGTLGVSVGVLNNGSVQINNQSYNLVENMRIKVSDDFGRVAYSDVIQVRAALEKYVVYVPTQSMVGPPNTFTVDVELQDTKTGNLITTRDHEVRIKAYSSENGLPATGNLGITSAMLQNGKCTINQSYDKIENIFLEIWDPAAVVPDAFSSDILITAGAGTKLDLNLLTYIIEPENTISIVAILQDDHNNNINNAKINFAVIKGEAYLNTSFDLTNSLGEASVTVTCNKYAKDGEIIIMASTDQVSKTVTIQVYGVPQTNIVFNGISSDINGAIHAKPTTPIILSSSSRIGLNKIYYRIDGGVWKEYIGSIFITEIGIHTIEYYAVDINGHKENTKISKSIYISVALLDVNKAVNYPNPFRAGKEPTFIEYRLNEPSNVTITIYDLLGQIVWEKKFSEGENGGWVTDINRVEWWGFNGLNEIIGNGGYICRIWIEKENRRLIRKIAVVK